MVPIPRTWIGIEPHFTLSVQMVDLSTLGSSPDAWVLVPPGMPLITPSTTPLETPPATPPETPCVMPPETPSVTPPATPCALSGKVHAAKTPTRTRQLEM